MPPTETKSYTPGAERAAWKIYERSDVGDVSRLTARGVAEIISRETHDAEMLEDIRFALMEYDRSNRELIRAHLLPESRQPLWIVRFRKTLAKVEGQ